MQQKKQNQLFNSAKEKWNNQLGQHFSTECDEKSGEGIIYQVRNFMPKKKTTSIDGNATLLPLNLWQIVPVMYQPPPQQNLANTVPNTQVPTSIIPNKGNSHLFPVENIKILEDTYSKFGNALRQLQNAQNLNLNNAQHVTYIVPYIRKLEHLYATIYN